MIPSEPVPSDDPAALQAMLAAERVENERLRKIIRGLQRHRFGRRAESLPPDQLQLGLEEAEGTHPARTAGQGCRVSAVPRRASTPCQAAWARAAAVRLAFQFQGSSSSTRLAG